MIVPIFGQGVEAKSRKVTVQRRLNCYLEQRKDGDKSSLVCYGTPGLRKFADVAELIAPNHTLEGPVRGMLAYAGKLAVVVPFRNNISNTLYNVLYLNTDGTASGTTYGTMDALESGRVDLAQDGTYLMAVNGLTGYTQSTPGNFTAIADVDYPTNTQTLAWLDQYFVVSRASSRRFNISAAADPTAWDALDFASAEANPDNLIRVMADHGELTLFGDVSTEFWSNTGAADFPFSAIKGSANEWGLAAQWSAVKFDNSLTYLAQNPMGEVMAAKMSGYQPQRISTFDLEHLWGRYTTVSDASGIAFMASGHPMFQLNFPTEGKSWLYDGAMGLWSEVKSFGVTRHRAEMGTTFNGRVYAADYANGKVYSYDPTYHMDDGDPIERELVTRHIFSEDRRLTIDRLWLDMEVGTTTLQSGQGSDPQVMLQVSRDGGNTWGNELWTTLGRTGEYTARVEWRRLGMGRDVVFRIRMTDPAPFVIVNGAVDVR